MFKILLILFGIYLILFGIFLIFFAIVRKHLFLVLEEVENQLDKIFYYVSLKIHLNKSNIEKFDEFVDIMKYNKEKFFENNIDIFTFPKFWSLYRKDIDFFSKTLFDEEIVPKYEIDKMDRLIEGLAIIGKYYKFIRKTLCIFTLGLFCFIK